MAKLNVVVGKFGRAVLFDKRKWAAVGGDNEPSSLFLTLARMNPDVDFYMLGRSDMRDFSEGELPPNMIDVWEGKKTLFDGMFNWPAERLKDVDVHAGIMMSGPASGTSIPGVVRMADGSEGHVTPTDMQLKYAGPMMHYLNTSGIPYFVVSPDPRYIKLGRDCINPPVISLSQYDTEVRWKAQTAYDNTDLREVVVPVRYVGTETMFLLGRERPDFNALPEKDVEMAVVLNEGGRLGTRPRGEKLQRYALMHFPKMEVYGKWSEPYSEDDRFVGPVPFEDLQRDVLPRLKYTVIIPIKRGWVTAKYWEMAHYGIVPFMHPEYDMQRHVPCPDYLRLNSPMDLAKRVRELNADEDKLGKVLAGVERTLLPKYYDGSHINKVVMSAVDYVMRKSGGRR